MDRWTYTSNIELKYRFTCPLRRYWLVPKTNPTWFCGTWLTERKMRLFEPNSTNRKQNITNPATPNKRYRKYRIVFIVFLINRLWFDPEGTINYCFDKAKILLRHLPGKKTLFFLLNINCDLFFLKDLMYLQKWGYS